MFAQKNIITVRGVSIKIRSNLSTSTFEGKARLAKLKTAKETDAIKVTVHYYQNNTYNVVQSDPERFDSKLCQNGVRKDLNTFNDKKDIFLSYGSGRLWRKQTGQQHQKRELFTSVHFYDPKTSELILLNLGYDEDAISLVLLFVSSQVKWHQIKNVLNAFNMYNLFSKRTLNKLNRELFPAAIKSILIRQ